MKISNINNMAIEQLPRNEADDSAAHLSNEKVFKSQLSNETKTAYMQHIETLVSDIEKQGQKLAKRADMADLQKYREMITQLINETVSNGFVFQKEGKITSSGRSKIFASIRTINEKLDQMTQKVLKQEENNINLLDEVDDIRGLLVDMYF
ncbi:MAG: YaaR family protein [Christensenellaceae bacterium]|jgi:uncharacterized protein YaaR (DUF327 family)